DFSLRAPNKMTSRGLCEAPADQASAQHEECLVNRGQTLVSYPQASKLMQPRNSAFHYPSSLAQAAAMRRIATCNLCVDSLLGQFPSQGFRLIGTIGLDELWFALGRTAQPGHWRNGPDQWQQLRDIVSIGPGQDQRKRDTLRIREYVVFAA